MIRLKQIRESKGWTQQQVADALGIHLTNYNKLENGNTELTVRRMEQLATILHCDPAEFVSNFDKIRLVKVRQHVEAGTWSESPIWPESEWYEVAVPSDPQWQNYDLYAAETRGPSMNRRYPEGSVLVYTDIIQTGETPQVGRRYIVEIERSDGLREATVKTLWADEAGTYWLIPESNDPRHQSPIRVNGDDGDIIRIVGRIRYSVQREI